MSGLVVERYQPANAGEWNAFVEASKNGTFLFDRNYMDYHAARFDDHSLLIRKDDGDMAALLPANENGGVLQSHAGLTYGGLVLGDRTGGAAAVDFLQAVRNYLQQSDLSSLLYKTIPSIYHRLPAEEDRYALFVLDARLTRRDMLSVIPAEGRIRLQNRRARGAKSAIKAGVQVTETEDFSGFWKILEGNLLERFGVAPVHSLAEISMLRGRFPASIRLFEARLDDRPIAGVVVFESLRVAHVQYISANAEGKHAHALDAVFDELIHRRYVDKPFFDFGISNEDNGRVVNTGLLEQKEGFGARSIIHDYYELAASPR